MARSPLTWQQVTAPDFTNVGKLLGQANQSFTTGVGNFTSLVRQNANNYQEDANELMQQRALQHYGDVGALQQMYNSGGLTEGINPVNVKANNIASLMNSALTTGDTLLKYKDNENTLQNKIALQDFYNNNPETIEKINNLLYEGKYPEAQQEAYNLDAPGHIVNSFFNNQAKNAEELNKLATASRERKEKELTDKETQDVAAFSSKLESMPSNTESFAEIHAILKDPNLRPTAKVAYEALVNKRFPGLLGTVDIPPTTETANDAITQLYGKGLSNKLVSQDYSTDDPSSNLKVDTVELVKDSPWTGYKPGSTTIGVLANDESSAYVNDKGQRTHRAMGAYQFMPATLKDAIKEGVVAENEMFDAKNQYKAGKWLYNKQNASGRPMTDRWTSLAKIKGADAPDAWKDIPWEVAERFIRAGESEGIDLSGLSMDDVRSHVVLRDQAIAKQQEEHKTALLNDAKKSSQEKPNKIPSITSKEVEQRQNRINLVKPFAAAADVVLAPSVPILNQYSQGVGFINDTFGLNIPRQDFEYTPVYDEYVRKEEQKLKEDAENSRTFIGKITKSGDPTTSPVAPPTRQPSSMSPVMLEKIAKQHIYANPANYIEEAKKEITTQLHNLGIAGSDPGVALSMLTLQNGILHGKLTTDSLVNGDASAIAGIVNSNDESIPIKLYEKYSIKDKDSKTTRDDLVNGFNKIQNELRKVNDTRKTQGLPPINTSNKTVAFILDNALQGNWDNWPDLFQGSTSIGGGLGVANSKIQAYIGSLVNAQASNLDFVERASKLKKLQEATTTAEKAYIALGDPRLRSMHDYKISKDPNATTQFTVLKKAYEDAMDKLTKYSSISSK